MKAAVTGATGFVGSHLAAALRRRGDEVACLVRSVPAAAPLKVLGCATVAGDLEDARALEALVRGADVVYHVAGRVAAPGAAEFMAANRDGTAEVARAARQAGTGRLLYVSSLAVTGPAVPGRPLDESGEPRPVTPYGRSKQAGEEAVRASGVPFTIVRPSVVYGPRDRALLRLFRFAQRGWAPLLGDGTQELSLVHGADLAEALVAAATAPATLGRVYHAAHPETATQRGLMTAIGRALGLRVVLTPLPRPVVGAVLRALGTAARMTGRPRLLDPSKTAELLAPAWICTSAALERDAGWRAPTSLDQGLAQTAAWYREAGWL